MCDEAIKRRKVTQDDGRDARRFVVDLWNEPA